MNESCSTNVAKWSDFFHRENSGSVIAKLSALNITDFSYWDVLFVSSLPQEIDVWAGDGPQSYFLIGWSFLFDKEGHFRCYARLARHTHPLLRFSRCLGIADTEPSFHDKVSSPLTEINSQIDFLLFQYIAIINPLKILQSAFLSAHLLSSFFNIHDAKCF